jgi:acyl carrier protein
VVYANAGELVETSETRIIEEVLTSLSRTPPPDGGVTAGLSLREDLGIESIQLLVLVLELETRLGRRVFSADNIASLRSVSDIFAALDASRG